MKNDSSSRRSFLASSPFLVISQTLLVGVLIGGLLSLTASPIYAWWFDSAKPERSVTPTHQSGLVLSPFIQSIVPQFVLEPLTTEEVEAPPSTEAPEAENRIVLTPVNEPTPTPAASSQPTSIAEQMLRAVNAERVSHGLEALTLNAQLTRSAQAYALKMQQLNFFSHTDPNGGTFRQRNEAAGYTNWQWMGENIAYGQPTVAEVVKDWMNSPLHRDNILEPQARELGVGYVGGDTPYWVQEFGVQF